MTTLAWAYLGLAVAWAVVAGWYIARGRQERRHRKALEANITSVLLDANQRIQQAVRERDAVIRAATPLCQGKSVFSFTGQVPHRTDEMAWNAMVDVLDKEIQRITGQDPKRFDLDPERVLAALKDVNEDRVDSRGQPMPMSDRPYAHRAEEDMPE